MIDEGLWLPRAMRLPVNGRERIYHLSEHRPNLVIGNDEDKFWCYCQRCKEGGVREKQYVKLTGSAPPVSADLTLPSDIEPHTVCGALIERYLLSKDMDLTYVLPYCQYLGISQSRMRLMVQVNGKWLGRDMTGASLQKWIAYNRAEYLSALAPEFGFGTPARSPAVVVEDAFSWMKVSWAMRGLPVSVYCALGTKLQRGLLRKFISIQQSTVLLMLDGDDAGYDGVANSIKLLRPYNIRGVPANAPAGKDPKNMGVLEIRAHLNNLIGGISST